MRRRAFLSACMSLGLIAAASEMPPPSAIVWLYNPASQAAQYGDREYVFTCLENIADLPEYREIADKIGSEDTEDLEAFRFASGRKLHFLPTRTLGRVEDHKADDVADFVPVKILNGTMRGNTLWVRSKWLTANEPPPAFRFEPEKDWEPDEGDEVCVYTGKPDGVAGAADGLSAFGDLIRFGGAGDDVGLRSLIKDGSVVALREGTKLRIIEVYKRLLTAKGFSAIEVRVLSGDEKDRLLWISPLNVAKMRKVEIKGRNPDTRRPLPQASTKDNRAAMLLKSGQEMEKLKNNRAARDYYGKVIFQYPDSPQAKVAEELLNKLPKP